MIPGCNRDQASNFLFLYYFTHLYRGYGFIGPIDGQNGDFIFPGLFVIPMNRSMLHLFPGAEHDPPEYNGYIKRSRFTSLLIQMLIMCGTDFIQDTTPQGRSLDLNDRNKGPRAPGYLSARLKNHFLSIIGVFLFFRELIIYIWCNNSLRMNYWHLTSSFNTRRVREVPGKRPLFFETLTI